MFRWKFTYTKKTRIITASLQISTKMTVRRNRKLLKHEVVLFDGFKIRYTGVHISCFSLSMHALFKLLLLVYQTFDSCQTVTD